MPDLLLSLAGVALGGGVTLAGVGWTHHLTEARASRERDEKRRDAERDELRGLFDEVAVELLRENEACALAINHVKQNVTTAMIWWELRHDAEAWHPRQSAMEALKAAETPTMDAYHSTRAALFDGRALGERLSIRLAAEDPILKAFQAATFNMGTALTYAREAAQAGLDYEIMSRQWGQAVKAWQNSDECRAKAVEQMRVRVAARPHASARTVGKRVAWPRAGRRS